MSQELKPFIIGLTGVARSGKDSLCDSIISLFPNIKFKKISLAEPLKKELDSFLLSSFGISAFTTDPIKKELIRPIMVEYARVKRITSKGEYYKNIAQNKINEAIFNNLVPIITDIRYCEYERDEITLIKDNNGFLINIEKLDINNKIVPPANKDELKNSKLLKKLANIKLKIPHLNKEEYGKYIISTVKPLIQNEFNRYIIKNGQ